MPGRRPCEPSSPDHADPGGGGRQLNLAVADGVPAGEGRSSGRCRSSSRATRPSTSAARRGSATNASPSRRSRGSGERHRTSGPALRGNRRLHFGVLAGASNRPEGRSTMSRTLTTFAAVAVLAVSAGVASAATAEKKPPAPEFGVHAEQHDDLRLLDQGAGQADLREVERDHHAGWRHPRPDPTHGLLSRSFRPSSEAVNPVVTWVRGLVRRRPRRRSQGQTRGGASPD